jgi:hypothetical protein
MAKMHEAAEDKIIKCEDSSHAKGERPSVGSSRVSLALYLCLALLYTDRLRSR